MIQLRHTGLYVKDIDSMGEFYKKVFNMHPVIENKSQNDVLIKDIFQNDDTEVIITKLITDQGRVSGFDDMLELIEVKKTLYMAGCDKETPIFAIGKMHLGFGVDNIEIIVKNVMASGGRQLTDVRRLGNGNKCCFCQDPEGNYLELIEQKK